MAVQTVLNKQLSHLGLGVSLLRKGNANIGIDIRNSSSHDMPFQISNFAIGGLSGKAGPKYGDTSIWVPKR